MNAAETKLVCDAAFGDRLCATFFEATIGAAILKAERKAKHVAKIPADKKAKFGGANANLITAQEKVLELVAALKGKPPLSGKQLGAILGCTRETAGKRAREAISQGLASRSKGKVYKGRSAIFVYEIAKGPKP
jgi:biotin operon repressor